MSQLQSHTQHRGIGGTGHGGQHWMMLACCIPMLLVAVALVVTGVSARAPSATRSCASR